VRHATPHHGKANNVKMISIQGVLRVVLQRY
jgi:hypothetical protein